MPVVTDDLAASAVGLDGLASERDAALAALCAGSCRLGLHSGLDLASHGKEGLFDVRRGLRGSLKEFDSEAVSKLLSLFGRHDTLCRQIGLVAHKELVDVFASVSVNLVQPLLHVVERLIVCHIVYNNDSVGSAVVRRSDGTETFLSGCVPDLKLDGLAIELDGADFLLSSRQQQQ